MIPVVTAPTTAAALVALGLPGALLDLLIPSGTEWAYNAGGAAPTGFVFPIGQACTPTFPDYRAKLIAAGSPYGTNGVDPLMPDRRSSIAVGKSNMGGVDNGLMPGGTVLGALVGGNVNGTLVAGNIPTLVSVNAAQAISVTAPANNFATSTGVEAIGFQAGATNKNIPTSANLAVGSSVAAANNSISVTYTNGALQPYSRVQLSMVCNIILKVH
jgi:hypothetical protein